MEQWTDEDITQTIQITTNVISLLAILLYFNKYYYEFDENYDSCVEETYYLIISDLIISFGHIMIVKDANNFYDENSMFDQCRGQAFVVHFGILCSFVWANLQGLKLYSIIYQETGSNKEREVSEFYNNIETNVKVVLAFGFPFVFISM